MSNHIALLETARQWRSDHTEHSGGVVLIWQGTVYGWKDCLRDANQERPGVYAVDEAGQIFIADGGDDYNGADTWVDVDPTGNSGKHGGSS